MKAMLLVGAAFVASVVTPAVAQTTTVPANDAAILQQDDDIVVTAQKQTRSLRDTSASVAVLSADTLARSNIATLDDLGRVVPSLTTLPAGNQLRPNYTIRGIGTDLVTVGAPSGVAVLIDGVTLSPESVAARQLSDIQNVEVLRGPQSTLGGRTASIGVINIVTQKPSRTWQGKVDATITTDNEYRLSGFVAGPISDTLAFSLSGFGSSTQLPTRNLNTGDHDKSQAEGVRGKLLFQPTPDLDVTLTGMFVHSRDKGAMQAYIGVAPTALFRGSISQAVALPGITPVAGNTDYRTITTPGQNLTDQFYSLNLNYHLGGFTVSSITARQIENRSLRFDIYNEAIDWIALLTNGASTYNNIQTSDLKVRTFSQEFKVASPDLGFMRFIAGLYYDHNSTGYDFDRPATGFAPLLFTARRNPDTKTYAAYGRADFKVTGTTTLIAGLRYNRDTIGYLFNQQRFAPAAYPVPFTRTDSSSKSTLVGDVTLKQDIGRRANVYATYSRGYKPEIWNLDGLVTPTNTFVPVGREKINDFELGLKGDFFNRLLTLNAAAFYTVYNNFQVQSLNFNGAATTFDVRNAGKASTRGIELDGVLRPASGTTMNFSLARIDAKFDSYVGAVCYSGQTAAQGCITTNGASSQDLTGQRLPRSPKWKFNIGVDHLVSLSDQFNLDLGATANYQSRINFDANASPRAFQNAYALFNLSAGLLRKDNRYSVTLFVNNITDKSFVSQIVDISGRWGNQSAILGSYSREAHRYGGVRFGTNF